MMRLTTVGRWCVWGVGLAATLSCCFPFGSDDDETNGGGYGELPPECTTDPECSHLDTDDDVCTVADCQYGMCAQREVRDNGACQCWQDSDCVAASPCAAMACVDHQCVEEILAEGSAADQEPGDCGELYCDGESAKPTVIPDPNDVPDQFAGDCEALSCDPAAPEIVSGVDPADLPDDDNECTADTCGENGPEHTAVDNGTTCGGDGFCFRSTCMACAPSDPSACGSEGPNEPENDTTPTPYGRYGNACGMLDGSDEDWYTFYADDRSFVYDVLDIAFWSTASTLEVCAYVSCHNGGTPSGGCSNKIAGPNGSQGCCWSGADTLAPSWDLDCLGTSEDSGTVYIQVTAPGASACEVYAMTANY